MEINKKNTFRIEHDSIGEINVSSDVLWGAQTQRSFQNFKIGKDKMPLEIIYALALLKKCCAIANNSLGKLTIDKSDIIIKSADEILNKKHDLEFPLVIFQTGSGTQSNMNVNEVIANISKLNYGIDIHPNDDVNMSQSSNDVFPSAIHIASYMAIHNKLLPSLNNLIVTMKHLEEENKDIIKIGRTHLQDATPLTLGQEISGWRYSLESSYNMIENSSNKLLELAIGGTAVGTGINSPNNFSSLVCENLRNLTKCNFHPSPNKFHSLTSKDEVVFVQGSLNSLASDLFKIANDIRWLASGPRCGIGEIIIPSNEPGSSIMPGKVNPTQCEAVTMVCLEVFGSSTTINFAASSGNFELNVYMPVIAFNLLKSINLLSDAMDSFNKNCVSGIKANIDIIKKYVDNSLMLVTALNPIIGYDNAAKVAKYAYENKISLKAACLALNLLDEKSFDMAIDLKKMI